MSEDQEKRKLRDEVAELARAVRELREEVSRRQAQPCCHCHCYHWHYTPVPYYPTITLPYTVTYGGGTVTATNAYQAAIQ